MRLARSVPALRGDRPPLTSPRPDAPRRKTRDLAPVTAEYEREEVNLGKKQLFGSQANLPDVDKPGALVFGSS